MMTTIAQKQEKIDSFLNTFIKMSAFEDNAGPELAIEVCETLDSVVDDNYFLPRYYSISNLLTEYKQENHDLYDRSSSLRELLVASQAFLKKLKAENALCKKHKSLLRYCNDIGFRYSVNEFYSSAQHEIIIYEASSISKRTNNSLTKFKRIEESIYDLTNSLSPMFGTLNEANKKLKQADGKINKADKKINKANIKLQQAEDLLPNMLTTMGIFVSIIIAVVAIYLSVVVHNNSMSIIRTFFLVDSIQARIILILFLGLFAFDLLFIFLYWISKLSGRSIACSCLGCDGQACEANKCKPFLRVIKRYWNFIAINAFAIILIVVLFVSHDAGLTKEEKYNLMHDVNIYATTSPQPNYEPITNDSEGKIE